jgi:hypothetical protein
LIDDDDEDDDDDHHHHHGDHDMTIIMGNEEKEGNFFGSRRYMAADTWLWAKAHKDVAHIDRLPKQWRQPRRGFYAAYIACILLVAYVLRSLARLTLASKCTCSLLRC